MRPVPVLVIALTGFACQPVTAPATCDDWEERCNLLSFREVAMDGTLRVERTRVHDEQGRVVEERWFDHDGTPTLQRVRHTWLDDRRIGETTFDHGDNGTVDTWARHTWTPEGDGWRQIITHSAGAPPSPQWVETVLWDEAWRETYLHIDSDADGTDDILYSTTYDETGRVIGEAVDWFGDGSVVQRFTLSYDDAGMHISTWEYDETGRQVAGFVYERDDCGRLLEERDVTTDAPNALRAWTPDGRPTFAYRSGDYGHHLRLRWSGPGIAWVDAADAEGRPTWTALETWDPAQRQRVSETVDEDRDGAYDVHRTWSWSCPRTWGDDPWGA